jgi:hypothetical protein
MRSILIAALVVIGCNGGSSTTSAPSASASASVSASTPAPSASASVTKPYDGPTGTLTGVLRVKGDAPPRTHFEYPRECRGAEAVYGKLFRVGLEGELADAVVSATHYKGFIPPKDKVVAVTIKDCAYSARTFVMTDGQHIEVKNLDGATSYIPHLDGARSAAVMVAVPKGDPVKLYSRGISRYWLRDQMGRNFMVADVFHFPYSTAAVTGLDGRYRLEGLPVGKLQVHVTWPAARMKTITQEFEIKKGDNVLDLTIDFDAEKDSPPKRDDKPPKNESKGSDGKSGVPAPPK